MDDVSTGLNVVGNVSNGNYKDATINAVYFGVGKTADGAIDKSIPVDKDKAANVLTKFASDKIINKSKDADLNN